MICGTRDIDLAFIDYALPPKGGAWVSSQMKKQEIPTPVIITIHSSKNDAEIEAAERETRSLGIEYFMITPCDLNDVRAVVRRLMKVRKRLCASFAVGRR
jgi:DNA-binding NtrC family response regulator